MLLLYVPLKLFMFATNKGRYSLELSVGDLPACCQTHGNSYNPQTQSYHNRLGEDDPKIMELWPQASQEIQTLFIY